jgi:phosphorylcholine metabolism protein LicD
MIMKSDSDNFKVIFGHVELDQARFTHGEETGVEFMNQIDTWTQMEVVFRQQIKYLKKSKTLKRTHTKKAAKKKSDLQNIIYAFREKFD